jgi:O-antigen/teichoic acid export membrane protein
LKKLTINNTTGLQAFQLIRYGALIGISIFLTKFGLSREQIGIYETVLFISGLLTFFWISGLTQAMLPLIKLSSDEKSPELFNAFLVLILFSVASLAIGFFFESLFRKLDTISNFPFFGLALIYTALNAPGNLIEYIYLLKNRPKSIVAYGTVIFALQLLSVMAAILLGFEVIGAIYALMGVSVLKLIWVSLLVLKYSRIKFSLPFIEHFMALGLPLTGKFLLSGSATYIDSLIITSRFNLATFAIFRYGARDLPLVTLMANGLSNSTLPEFAEQEKLKRTLTMLKERSLWLMHFLFPVTMVTIILSKPLFPIIFNPDFKDSAEIFMIYLLTISSRMVFPQTVAIGLKKTRALLSISFFELALNVSLSLLFVGWFGIAGVAWATVIAFLFEKMLITSYLYVKLGIKPALYTPLKQYFLYSALTLLVFIFAMLWL